MGRTLYAVMCAILAIAVGEVVVLRRQVAAQEREVRDLQRSHSRDSAELLQSQSRIDALLRTRMEEQAASLRETLAGIEGARTQLAERAGALERLIKVETESLERTMASSIGSREGAIAEALERSAANALHIESVKKGLRKDPRSMKESMIYPTVQLRGNGTVGSGVIVFSAPAGERDGKPRYAAYVLTAYHVVLEVTREDSRHIVEDIRIMGEGDVLRDDRLSARVVTFDVKRDIALLKLDTDERLSHVARFVSPRDIPGIQIFEPAYAVGCPLGNMPLPSAGEITTKGKKVDGQTFWMLNAPTYFGNSGGGVFRARNGTLIGVSSMIYTYGRKNPVVVPHLGLFVPAEVIFKWLDEEGFGFIYDAARAVPVDLAAPRSPPEEEGAGAGAPSLRHARFSSTDRRPED